VAGQFGCCCGRVVDEPNLTAAVVGAALGFPGRRRHATHLTSPSTELGCDTLVFGFKQSGVVLDVAEVCLSLGHAGRVGRGVGVVVIVGD
jgi:hypothetical protein